MATTNPYSLHRPASLKSEAEKVAAAEGTTLDQFINVAVAEKLAALPSKTGPPVPIWRLLTVCSRRRAMSHRALGMRCCRQKINVPIKTGCFLSP